MDPSPVGTSVTATVLLPQGSIRQHLRHGLALLLLPDPGKGFSSAPDYEAAFQPPFSELLALIVSLRDGGSKARPLTVRKKEARP